MKNTTTQKADLYQEVTNAIIEKMRSGNLIWKRGCNGFLATNWITKTTYSGINYVLLNLPVLRPRRQASCTHTIPVPTMRHSNRLSKVAGR